MLRIFRTILNGDELKEFREAGSESGLVEAEIVRNITLCDEASFIDRVKGRLSRPPEVYQVATDVAIGVLLLCGNRKRRKHIE